jgi:peptide-methionine (S)-S-oxide reductase
MPTRREILEVFFSIHDPTTLNRQGADVGTQYRSIILFHSPEQERVAREVIAEQQARWSQPIVTELVPFDAFYRAEEYHQEYYQKNPFAGYCQMVVRPKVDKFRHQYADRLKQS